MSKADKMFRGLGYEIIYKSNVKIVYEREGQFFDKEIIFGLIDKIVTAELSTGESTIITMEELQAINEKVKELGWVGE